jgi:hypothetical protein
VLTIVQRGGATREKPPEVVRGQASRLPWAWDGLCFAVPFNDATRDSARDLVYNAAPSEWVGTPVWGKDNRGNVAAFGDTSTYFGYAETPVHIRPSTSLTVCVRLRRNGAVVGGNGALAAKVHTVGGVGGIYDTWWIGPSDLDANKLGGDISINGTEYYWVSNGYSTDTTTWMSVFLRWTSGTEPRLDVLGERGQAYDSTGPGSAISGTLTYNTSIAQPIRINHGDGAGINSAYNAAYSQVLVWSRRLTDTEMQALVADPYGWYSPRRSTIVTSSPYPLAFGASEMRHGTGSGGLR